MTNYLMPGPWQDVRVRKAINYAIDMDTIINRRAGSYGQVLARAPREGSLRFNPNIKWYGYDPERAKPPARGRPPNGFEMTLHSPTGAT